MRVAGIDSAVQNTPLQIGSDDLYSAYHVDETGNRQHTHALPQFETPTLIQPKELVLSPVPSRQPSGEPDYKYPHFDRADQRIGSPSGGCAENCLTPF